MVQKMEELVNWKWNETMINVVNAHDGPVGGEKATEREWKKWLIEFNVSCATLFDQKLLKKFTPLPSIVKRFFHSPNCPEHDSYCDNFSTFFFRRRGNIIREFLRSSINSVNGAKSCKVNCTISNGFLMISPSLCFRFSLRWLWKARKWFVLHTEKSLLCGFFTSFSVNGRAHHGKFQAHFLALINFFLVSTLDSLPGKCFFFLARCRVKIAEYRRLIVFLSEAFRVNFNFPIFLNCRKVFLSFVLPFFLYFSSPPHKLGQSKYIYFVEGFQKLNH